MRSILSRLGWRRSASVSTLIAQARANSARAETPAAQPQPSPEPVRAAAQRAALALGFLVLVTGAIWGATRFELAPRDVRTPSEASAAPVPPSSVEIAAAPATSELPRAAPIARQPAPQPVEAAPIAAPRLAPIEPPAPPAILAGDTDGAARSRVVDILAQGEPLRLRVLARAEARSRSNGRWAHGLEVVEASAGNALDVRRGDVIYDLCDRAGDQTAAQIMAGLASAQAPTCVAFVRGG